MGKRHGQSREKNVEARRKAYVETILKNAEVAKHTDSMISRITLRDVATFSSEGTTIKDLQRVNFIFGGNGCGKTTISRLLASVSGGSHTPEAGVEGVTVAGTGKYKNCEVEWTGIPVKVLVYNKDFRKKNLKENIPGVFTLGKESVEAETRLEEKKRELSEKNKELISKEMKMGACERQMAAKEKMLRETLWNEVYMHQCLYFEDCLKGVVTGNRDFAKRMKEMVADGSYKEALERENLQGRYSKLYKGEKLEHIEELIWPDEAYEVLMEVMGDEIWVRSVVANGDSETSACVTCEKRTFSLDFLKGLGKHFDDLYKKDVDKIRRLVQRYHDYSLRLKEYIYSHLNVVQTSERMVTRHTTVMSMKVEMLKELLSVNYHIMQNKLENPSMVAHFKNMAETVTMLKETMADINEEIRDYNEMVDHQEPERERLQKDMMRYMASRSAERIMDHEAAMADKRAEMAALMEGAEDIKKKTKVLVAEIKELEKKVASTKPTVASINHQLTRYGFTGFRIQPTKDGNYYQIQREDGSYVMDTLSEGETTFITFLYYMQLVNGGESQNLVQEPKVVVIDDPISSLDSAALNTVSEMIKPVMEAVSWKKDDEGVTQVIVLTHNMEFHKKMTYKNGRIRKLESWHYWRLRKLGGVSWVKEYGIVNPVKNGYEQLWRDLKDGIEEGHSVQNTMRKILERYFVKCGGYTKKELINMYSEDEEERIEITELLRWTDDGSHEDEEDLYGEDPQVAGDRYLMVFRELFVRLGHDAHYHMMMRE